MMTNAFFHGDNSQIIYFRFISVATVNAFSLEAETPPSVYIVLRRLDEEIGPLNDQCDHWDENLARQP